MIGAAVRYLLFDLDGTITDSGIGIMKSAQYSLKHFGFPNESEKNLRRFVGPPLHLSFQTFYGLSEERSFEAVEKYREHYREKGVYECPLYEGMGELLFELSKKAAVCLATSKPKFFADKILELHGLGDCFTVKVGAELDGTRTDKAEVITEVLRMLGSPDKSEVLMIGDRMHDIIGAKTCGIKSIGVLWGYSEENELKENGADYIVSTAAELRALLSDML